MFPTITEKSRKYNFHVKLCKNWNIIFQIVRPFLLLPGHDLFRQVGASTSDVRRGHEARQPGPRATQTDRPAPVHRTRRSSSASRVGSRFHGRHSSPRVPKPGRSEPSSYRTRRISGRRRRFSASPSSPPSSSASPFASHGSANSEEHRQRGFGGHRVAPRRESGSRGVLSRSRSRSLQPSDSYRSWNMFVQFMLSHFPISPPQWTVNV